ncbi:MAG TPA: hypothetical protein VL651_12025 [Bacteroidia bacterium]|jgi:hypothetical protein|nr:hypothetical protein [Bacteroidia bacterium]
MKPQLRINNPAALDFEVIEKELLSGKHVIIQFVSPGYSELILSQLNDLCRKYDHNFGIRFYGHYSGSFDFNVLLRLPCVKCLYVDCLVRAENVQAIAELTQLEELSLGVFELSETGILRFENLKRLRKLILGETRTKALDLIHIKDYKNLSHLTVNGHTKNIEAIGELSELEYLSFNSIRKTPVPFVNRLKKLKTLKFILGGRADILEITENSIEELEIVWVRGFNNLDNISNFRKLKRLRIEDNIQLQELHFTEEFPQLTDLRILNCKTLNSLTGLGHLTALFQLRIYKTNLAFQEIINQNLPKTLQVFSFVTAKKKIDEVTAADLQRRGYRNKV